MDDATARRAGAAFEAMVLEPVVAPLAGLDGAFGSVGAAMMAQEIGALDDRGFGAALARVLERRHG